MAGKGKEANVSGEIYPPSERKTWRLIRALPPDSSQSLSALHSLPESG